MHLIYLLPRGVFSLRNLDGLPDEANHLLFERNGKSPTTTEEHQRYSKGSRNASQKRFFVLRPKYSEDRRLTHHIHRYDVGASIESRDDEAFSILQDDALFVRF